MSTIDVLDWLLRAAFALGIPGAVVWYVRDRRKSRAETAIVERTVDAEVELKDVAADEANLAYLQRQMDAERGFHRSQIADRDAEIVRQRGELEYRDQLITRLREQVTQLEAELAAMARRAASMRVELDELKDHPKEMRP